MREAIIALVAFLCLRAASLGSLFTYERLPGRYRGDDTQAIVRLVATLFVVMTSLVLGLMVNSAKSRFDAVNREVRAFAADLILFDRTLVQFGADAEDVRKRLLAYAERASRGASAGQWTGDTPGSKTSEELLDDVGNGLRSLHRGMPRTPP